MTELGTLVANMCFGLFLSLLLAIFVGKVLEHEDGRYDD